MLLQLIVKILPNEKKIKNFILCLNTIPRFEKVMNLLYQ